MQAKERGDSIVVFHEPDQQQSPIVSEHAAQERCHVIKQHCNDMCLISQL